MSFQVETIATSRHSGLLWMDELLHHFESVGNHCLLVAGSSFQGFLGDAGVRPSTVAQSAGAQFLVWSLLPAAFSTSCAASQSYHSMSRVGACRAAATGLNIVSCFGLPSLTEVLII